MVDNFSANRKSDSIVKNEIKEIVQKQEAKSEQKMEKMVEQKISSKLDKIEAKVDKMGVEEKKKWPHYLGGKTRKVLSEEEKTSLLEGAKISLWIDSYDDLFSDFDPRNYSKREISADFLSEAKRFARERLDGKVDLVILGPQKIRDKYVEAVIKKRLKQSFLQQYKFLLNKKRKTIKQGAIFILLGIFFMIVTTFILFSFSVKDFFIYFLAVIGEPAGWFLFWEGLNLIIFDSKEKKSDLEFNKKMSKIDILFSSYD